MESTKQWSTSDLSPGRPVLLENGVHLGTLNMASGDEIWVNASDGTYKVPIDKIASVNGTAITLAGDPASFETFRST